MQNYNTAPGRNLINAEREMLKKADPIKVLSSFGDQKQMPQNKTDTTVFRRPIPIDAAANGAPQVNASDYLLQEGTTPSSRTTRPSPRRPPVAAIPCPHVRILRNG